MILSNPIYLEWACYVTPISSLGGFSTLQSRATLAHSRGGVACASADCSCSAYYGQFEREACFGFRADVYLNSHLSMLMIRFRQNSYEQGLNLNNCVFTITASNFANIICNKLCMHIFAINF